MSEAPGRSDAGIRGEVLAVDDVTFAYAPRTGPGAGAAALSAVSIRAAAGEVVAVAGESGSGKSTLARLVAGLLRPTTGTVRAVGLETHRVRPRVLAGRVGLVFQNPNHQLLARTVRDELELGPRNLGCGEDEIVARARDAASRLDLGGVLALHPSRLSIPLRKRVAIAAVLAMRPRLLVLDEPTTGQSRREIVDIQQVVRAEAAAGTGVLVISHDLRFVSEVADRLVVLRMGRVAAEGAVRTLLGDPEALAAGRLLPPPLARVGLALGLDPVPLSVDEAVARLNGAADEAR